MGKLAVQRVEAESCTRVDLQAIQHLHSHLIASVCHEFRSTLTAVRGHARRMLDGCSGPLSDAQRGDLTAVQRNTDRLLELVSHTLPFIAEQRLRIESFDLRECWQAALQRTKFRASEKFITIREDMPDITVTGDRQRLAAVFEVILVNAIQCAPVKGEIRARFKRGVDGEGAVKITVPGAMLPAQELDRVFERSGNSQNPAVAGEGLRLAGLTLAHNLVWLHGGRFAVSSSVEQGAMFIVTLPPPVDSTAG